MEQNQTVGIFKNDEFGEVRTVKDGDKILFCGSDVAKALGYSNPSKALGDHCKGITKRYIPHPQSQEKQIVSIHAPLTGSDAHSYTAASFIPLSLDDAAEIVHGGLRLLTAQCLDRILV